MIAWVTFTHRQVGSADIENNLFWFPHCSFSWILKWAKIQRKKKMTVIRIFNRNYLSWQLPQGKWQMAGQKAESYMGLCRVNWHLCARPLLISLREKSLRIQESVLHIKVHICFCEHLSFCLWIIIFPMLLTSHICPVTHLLDFFPLAFFFTSMTTLLVLLYISSS